MKSTPIQIFSRLFWLVTLTDLLGMQLGVTWLHVIAKPLLMPLLIAMLFYSGIAGTKKKWILIGLFFSWLGDLFLLLDSKVPIFFIVGLGSFLITHIFYILYFLSIENSSPSLLKKQPLLIVLTLCYGSALVVLLFPYLGDLKIPVILYAAVICTMLLCSLHISRKLPAPSNSYFVAGALLFVLSDSLLAINKFYQPFAFAGTLIMLTYCAAQFYIVMGFIKRR
jgi:uncharacterized membrane protein YhhN